MKNISENWKVEDVGKDIFDAVPLKEKPDWAASILLYVAGEDICPEIQRLVEISFDDSRWAEAHDAFQKIRGLTLENEKKGKSESLQQLIYDVAETTAKVIYNASGASAPFDDHSGWRMTPRVKRIVDFVENAEFEKECWHLLSRTPAHNKNSLRDAKDARQL